MRSYFRYLVIVWDQRRIHSSKLISLFTLFWRKRGDTRTRTGERLVEKINYKFNFQRNLLRSATRKRKKKLEWRPMSQFTVYHASKILNNKPKHERILKLRSRKAIHWNPFLKQTKASVGLYFVKLWPTQPISVYDSSFLQRSFL